MFKFSITSFSLQALDLAKVGGFSFFAPFVKLIICPLIFFSVSATMFGYCQIGFAVFF